MERYPFIFSDEWKYRIRRHFAFWFTWWFFQAVLYSYLPVNTGQPYSALLAASSLDSLVYLSVHMFLSYSLMYFVIPRYVLKEKYIGAVLWVLIFFFLAAVLSSFCSLVVLPPLREVFGLSECRPVQSITAFSIHSSLMAGLRGGLTIGGLAASIKLIKSLYMKEQRNLLLQKENVASQLQLLKAQVHPHFLFNTLNNIYSYTQNTSPEASRLVTGLSDLLRFILYECNQPLIPLAKELTMIRDYIALEKVRYGNKLELHVDLPEETNDLHISPLLLLPLIENCFKHGTSHIIDQPWISLHITIYKEQHIHMKLLNGKSSSPNTEKKSSGIGIQNVRKRLELLYPNKHELAITDEQDVFIVNLKMELEAVHEPVLTNNNMKLTHA